MVQKTLLLTYTLIITTRQIFYIEIRFFVFFDDVNVDGHVTPASIVGVSDGTVFVDGVYDGETITTINGSGKVFLRTAPAGTGIIAGGAIRSVCEVLGIQDVVAKSLGSANPHNVLKACVNGLRSQNSPKILSAIRGKKISDIVLKRETK